MDLESLTLIIGDSILEGMDRLQEDCVYRCQINGSEGYIMTMVEHQSTADKLMAFRLLQLHGRYHGKPSAAIWQVARGGSSSALSWD